jgi:phosphate/sulfate permease
LAYAVLASALSLLVVPTAVYQTTPLAPARIALVAIAGAGLALVFEKPNWKHVDDDFLMNVGPMMVLAAILAVL